MASAYFKLKILNRKRSNLKKADRTKENENLNTQDCYLINKKNKCRICLLDGSISIFGEVSIEIRESIRLFGGIEISEEDTLPQYLCNNCYNLLQHAMLFRKKAQATNTLLRKQTINNIKNVDLKIRNENSKISNCVENVSENVCNELNKYTNENESSNAESKRFKCEVCKINLSSANELALHKKSKQHKNVRIQCPICKGLLTTQLYKKHLERHQSASHLVCDVCGKMYRKDNLIRHLQLHSYELPYKCKLCPYKGRFPESLKLHLRTHTGQKPFSCEKCNLRFLTRSNLNRHLLTHNKEKPFKCAECNRCFHTNRDMLAHFSTDHTGIKNFGCKTCGNKYGTRKALMRHEIRVHKREKMSKGRVPLYLQAEYKI